MVGALPFKSHTPTSIDGPTLGDYYTSKSSSIIVSFTSPIDFLISIPAEFLVACDCHLLSSKRLLLTAFLLMF